MRRFLTFFTNFLGRLLRNQAVSVRLEQVASGCSQIVVGRECKKISARPPNDTGNIYKYVQLVKIINYVVVLINFRWI